ncbi:ADP-ribosylglycohydrolase family protein [Enterovirga rhinocerotis]|uniref:ADP-ribosylglycohydrolase n=1 Tax=Enterovirga rhinocerotis TaxID=1339210 RepID=A0A4R7BM07_9HYPH|nr:ADP-ribosylglycohydrolase family protein [Enterovirga rhinocerotis]TDR85295.1 ADP-ribosylglycohydrolase [Enterovirga rhinocerotis]
MSSTQPPDHRDHALGALLGLAVGDALGTTLEFSGRDTKPPVTDMVGGGVFGLAPGQWTDDTSMALCLAEALIAGGGKLDEADLMRRFARWYRAGENSVTGRCFDIGNTVRAAIERFERTGQAIQEKPDPSQAGNGSLMRLAPVAILASPDIARAEDLAHAQSRTTHAAPVAHEACRLFATLLVEAISGLSRDQVLRPRPFCAELAAIAAGSWRSKGRAAISSSGYVVATLEASLWCVGHSRSFPEAVLLAANLGDDADTVAAVTGQLAGAIYGASAIPAKWRETIAWRDRIEDVAEELLDLRCRR